MRPSLKQTSTHPDQLKGPAQGSGLKGPRVQRTRARSFWMPPWDHARALHARRSRRCQHHNIITVWSGPTARVARSRLQRRNQSVRCTFDSTPVLCAYRCVYGSRLPCARGKPFRPVPRPCGCARTPRPTARRTADTHTRPRSPRSSLTGDWCLSRRREVSYRLSRNSTASVAVSPRKQTGEALTPSRGVALTRHSIATASCVSCSWKIWKITHAVTVRCPLPELG